MITENDIVEQLVTSVTLKVTEVIKANLSDIVQHEISKALAQSLGEGQYYRGLSDEVVDSVHNMFNEINIIKKSLVDGGDEAAVMLNKSDNILEGIIRSSEKSTLKIIEYLEQMQDEITAIRELQGNNLLPVSQEKLQRLESLLMDSMTELSFQDLGGQKIKRVVHFLKKMEEMVSEAYMTSEIFKKSRERKPGKDIREIRNDAKSVIENVREHNDVIDQDRVDTLLAELGL